MTSSPLRLAFELKLREANSDVDAEQFIVDRYVAGDSLRSIASDVSLILGRPVSHTTIDNWITTIEDEAS